MRKAQGLPLSTIAIAAIVLIVIVVVIVIFGAKMGWFTETAKSCTGLGGKCEKGCEDLGEIVSEIPNTDCSGDKPKCCKVIV